MAVVKNWNPAEFDHWYSQMPLDERKRRAWDSLRPDQRKLYTEWQTFERFAVVAPLDIDPRTIENREPPEPDIRCQMSRANHYFELGEVTDQTLAREAGEATKQRQEIFSGSFSQLSPLLRIFRRKCSRKYVTYGRPLHLLLHYSVGHQVPYTAKLRAEISKGHQEIARQLQTSPFSSLWLYDGWGNTVIACVQR